MKKLISLCVSISLLISFSAPLQAKGHSSKGKSSSRSSSSKKKSSAPKATPAPDGECPLSQISDSTIKKMLQNPKMWMNIDNIEKLNKFLDNNPKYRKKCHSELHKGYNYTVDKCDGYTHYAAYKDSKLHKLCNDDEKNPRKKFRNEMSELWGRSPAPTLVTWDPDREIFVEVEKGSNNGGNGKNDKGKKDRRKKDVHNNGKWNGGDNTNIEQKVEEKVADAEGTHLVLDNLTQEEYDNLRQASPDELPDTFKRLAEKLQEAISQGKDISKFIATLVNDSSLEPGSRNYVPFQFIQMAFLLYASTLRPNEAHKIMQYIGNSRQEIRYAVASAVAEYSKSSIGQNGRMIDNANPAGHLQLSNSQRSAAAIQLQQSIDSYKQDCIGKRLDQVRLFRLDQRGIDKKLIKYMDDSSCSLASVGTTALTLALSPEAALGAGIVLSAGVMFVAINNSYAQGYRDSFVSNLFSSLPSKEDIETVVTVTCDMTTMMVNNAINPAQEIQDDEEDVKGGNRMLATPVSWSRSYAQVGAYAHTSTSQPRIDCGDTGRSDPNADWGGRQWWRDRFPDGDSGAKMRQLIPALRKEIKALGGDVSQQSSAKKLIHEGRAVRDKLSRDAQMTLRELEEVNKNVIRRSNSFYNTAARGNSDAAFVKAVKVNGKWKPSVEIGTQATGVGQVIDEVLAPWIVDTLKTAVCAGGQAGLGALSLGRGKSLRYKKAERGSQHHIHYEEDKGTYECNNSIDFAEGNFWNAMVSLLCQ